MLTIREKQMRAFSQAAADDFEDWMVVHLKKFFPRRRSTSEPALRELIRYGVDLAKSYQIEARRDVCKYIDLMVVLGRDFDRDRSFPWAAPILGADKGGDVRMQWLTTTVQRQLKHAPAVDAKK